MERHGNTFEWQSVGTFESIVEFQFEKFPFDKVSTVVELYWEDPIGEVNVSTAEITILDRMWPGNIKFVDESSIWRWGNPMTETELTDMAKMNAITKFKFNFERRQEYYIMTVFAPMEILMVLQISAFIMPASALDRGAYSITVNLAFTVSQQVVNSLLPKTSQTIYLFYYITIYLGIGAAVTLVTLVMATLWETADWVHKKEVLWNTKITHGRMADIVAAIVFILSIIAVNIWYFLKVTE